MTSIAIALRGWNLTCYSNLKGMVCDPGALNSWLGQHEGYVDEDDLDEAAIGRLNPAKITWPTDGMHTKPDLSLETIKDYINKERIVIAHVRNRTHFVLAIGYSETAEEIAVLDSAFNNSFYEFNSILGWRIFDFK